MMQKSNKLGKTDLKISPFGFGGYRIDKNVSGSAASLVSAIRGGINLIDTSANYFDGGSEELIGSVIYRMLEFGEIKREEIVIVTKGGYIQGRNIELLEQRKESGNPYPEVVKCNQELYHSIHAEFLKDQIELSLNRLNLDFIDIYLLHNPEYFLLYNTERNLNLLRDEYYRRIREAFLYLEHEVELGRINHYGISSNTFVEYSEKRGFTSLERIIEIANSISKDNHFAVVQSPLNIFEKGAAQNLNQEGETKTFLHVADENKLGVLVNRPLNAIKDGKLFRLADFDETENRNESEIKELVEQQLNLEREIIEEYEALIPPHQKSELIQFLSLSKFLKVNLNKISSITHFNEIKSQHLVPQINHALKEIHNLDPDNAKTISKLNQLAVTANILLNSIGSKFAKNKNEDNLDTHNRLNKYFNNGGNQIPLSQKALKIVSELPEVSCVLVGMRKEEYVHDVISANNLEVEGKIKEFWSSD
jgi:aryl-alcohol dehydrogenase-like predicted oxidoreductase